MSIITMLRINLVQLAGGTTLSAVIAVLFVIWAETNPQALVIATAEDGLIESVSATLFGLASLCFLVALVRSQFLKSRTDRWRHVFMIGWILLMFVFCGEEISWGQRLFGFESPAAVSDVNIQGEFNLHNLMYVEQTKYTLLTLMMFVTGVLLPVMALNDRLLEKLRTFAIPVMPLAYMGFFVASYLFGKYYYSILADDAASEVRELLMSFGMLAFALHGALRPDDLFRIDQKAQTSGTS